MGPRADAIQTARLEAAVVVETRAGSRKSIHPYLVPGRQATGDPCTFFVVGPTGYSLVGREPLGMNVSIAS